MAGESVTQLQARMDRGDALSTAERQRLATGSWFKGPAGAVAHADGPSQIRAHAAQGWTEISEDEAKSIVAAGTHLTVQSDAAGTFDADAVSRALEEESVGHARRSAAAKKAAETRRRNQAAGQAAQPGEG